MMGMRSVGCDCPLRLETMMRRSVWSFVSSSARWRMPRSSDGVSSVSESSKGATVVYAVESMAELMVGEVECGGCEWSCRYEARGGEGDLLSRSGAGLGATTMRKRG